MPLAEAARPTPRHILPMLDSYFHNTFHVLDVPQKLLLVPLHVLLLEYVLGPPQRLPRELLHILLHELSYFTSYFTVCSVEPSRAQNNFESFENMEDNLNGRRPHWKMT